MALYRFAAGIISRSKGHSSTAAAAYRAGVALEDERTGLTHDYSRRRGVVWTGIYAPKNAPAWANDRTQLWNQVEAAEKRKDAQLAREFVIALPHELDLEQNRRLVQDFVRENFVRKGFAADVSIHAPSVDGDQRNIHAHILVTTRTINGQQFQATKDRTQNAKQTLEAWRESWENLGNRHLERAGQEATLDRRSYEAQGIERTARIHLGKVSWNIEQRGVETVLGDANRTIADHEQERAKLTAELAELERLYALEQEQKAAPTSAPEVIDQARRPTDRPDHFAQSVAAEEIAETRRELRDAEAIDRKFAAAKIDELYAEPEHVSAIDRMREDERREVEIRQRNSNPVARSLLGALWSLTRTMGNTLSHIILGADRSSLEWGRRLDLSNIAPQGTVSAPKIEPAPAPRPTPISPFAPVEEITLFRHPEPNTRKRQAIGSPANRLQRVAQKIAADRSTELDVVRDRAAGETTSSNQPAGSPPAKPREDLLAKIQREQRERMRELAEAMPRPGHELDNDLELY